MMDAAAIVKDFEWHTKVLKVKETIMPLTTPVVFAWIKEGSPYIQLLHSATKFEGGPFNPAEYQGGFIEFVGNIIMGVNPYAILVEDSAWDWTRAKVVKDMVTLANFWR